MSRLTDVKERLEDTLETFAAIEEVPEENKEWFQDEFIRDYALYIDILDNPSKYNVKVNRQKEREFEDRLIRRVFSTKLFDNTDQLIEKLNEYRKATEELERRYGGGVEEEEEKGAKGAKAGKGAIGYYPQKSRLAKRKGFETCTYCGGVIDVKYGYGEEALVMERGRPYHKACLELAKTEAAEERAESIWYVDGMPLVCTWCGEYIYQSQPAKPMCPGGAPKHTYSPLYCNWYHASFYPPYNCWFEAMGVSPPPQM